MKFASRRLKFCVRRAIVNGIGAPAEHDDPSWPRYVRITDIAGPRSLRDDTFMSLPPEQAEQAPFGVGDILAAAVGATFGKSYLHLRDIGPAAFAGYLVRISPSDEFDSGFVAYWTESQHYWDQLNTSVVQSTIQNFSAAKYAELRLPSPSLLVQRAIVRFLDRETARLDALVAAKQRVLDLLAEKCKAIIATAVTRGLDPKAKLRESGVPWLDEIPEHWDLVPIRYLLSLGPKNGISPQQSGADGALSFSISAVRDGRVTIEGNEKFVSLERDIASSYYLMSGDILLVRGNGNLSLVGTCGLVESAPDECTYPDILMLMRVGERIVAELLVAAVNSPYMRQQVESLAQTTNGTYKLSGEDVRTLQIAVPPLDEQRAIVDHIARETAKLDAVRATTERTVALLKERRSALIAAAVTGQIELGEAA